MADDAAGAVRRTPRPAPEPEMIYGTTRTDPIGTVREHDDGTTAVKVSTGDDSTKGQHVWCWMNCKLEVRWLHHYDVAEWAVLAAPAERPVVLLPAEDCDCTPPYADCPHGPEPVDALDLAVWLYAEQQWLLGSLIAVTIRHRDSLARQCARYFNREEALTAERVGLQARIDAALAVVSKSTDHGWQHLSPSEVRQLRTALQGEQAAEPWTPTVGERVTGVETQNVGQPVVTGYFHSSGVDGLSWLNVHADDPETAQRFLVGTATLKPAPPKPRCCIGPFADGTHAPGCLDACQDCGGDEAGPHRCQCRDVEPECTCTPSRCDYDGYPLDGPACLPCGQRPDGAPCLAVAEPTGEADRG